MSPTSAMKSTALGRRSIRPRGRRRTSESSQESDVRMRGLVRTALLLCAVVVVRGQTLPHEPPHEAGASITGALEGWFKNPDGTFTLLLGYYNRNRLQDVDVPVGPNNRIEPGGPDRGQPTHFMPGRNW